MNNIIKLTCTATTLLLIMNPGFANTTSLDEAIGMAKAALASRLDIPELDINLSLAQATDWPDSSLGCPEKETRYLPVITPGYLVKLTVDKDTYAVHVGGGRAVVCDRSPVPAKPARAQRSQRVLTLTQMARDDLAARLGIPTHRIQLQTMERKTWPDSSLGCAEPGKVYSQMETAGFRIVLEQDGEMFHYHTDMNRVVLCEEPPAPAKGSN